MPRNVRDELGFSFDEFAVLHNIGCTVCVCGTVVVTCEQMDREALGTFDIY